MKTILDTTAWLNFARADAIDALVNGMSGQLAVGLIVEQREMLTWPSGSASSGKPFSFGPLVREGLLEIAEMSSSELGAFYATKRQYRLGDGETEALVIAIGRGWRIATDDGAARRKFSSHNPPVTLTGTIGLLRELCSAKHVSHARATHLLGLMKARGGRLPNEPI